MTNHLLKVSRCLGIKDCDPPPMLKMIVSGFAMLVLFYVSDMVVYSVFDDYFSDTGNRETPLFANLLVGYLIASILFVMAYVYYGRPPRNDESKDHSRDRTAKGALFGFTVGSLVFIPAAFIMSSIKVDFDLTRELVDGIYHVIQIIIGGIIIAHLLGTPARSDE